jgi:hypothetical protein
VPRFNFDIREGAKFIPDEERLEFDLDATGREAARGAADIGGDQLSKVTCRVVTVEVRNEDSQRVITFRMSMETDPVKPPAGASTHEITCPQCHIGPYGTEN